VASIRNTQAVLQTAVPVFARYHRSSYDAWVPREMLMARILIVDDHPASLELVRAVLENDGYDVREARDGIEAVAMAVDWLPNLVLMDLQMPGMDGFATLRTLRNEPRLGEVPIVALTARAMQGYVDVVLGAGFSGYLTKPLSLISFRHQIRGFLKASMQGCRRDANTETQDFAE
jgi:two-component system cell cycle response regulator DivK